jgi:hypothetical protein
MSIAEQKTQVMGRIWQAIAQSGVSLAGVPREQQEVLVDHIADGVLLELDSMLGGVALPAYLNQSSAAAPAAVEEQLLWEGRPFLSLNERYQITTERIRVINGLVGRDHEDIELVRVQDVDHRQNMAERVMNIGDVYIHTADPSRQDVTLTNVKDPTEVHEILRKAVLNARRRYPFIFEQKL